MSYKDTPWFQAAKLNSVRDPAGLELMAAAREKLKAVSYSHTYDNEDEVHFLRPDSQAPEKQRVRVAVVLGPSRIERWERESPYSLGTAREEAAELLRMSPGTIGAQRRLADLVVREQNSPPLGEYDGTLTEEMWGHLNVAAQALHDFHRSRDGYMRAVGAPLVWERRDLAYVAESVGQRIVSCAKLLSRWPCPECGREGPEAELRAIERVDGTSTGCFSCNVGDRVVGYAEELLAAVEREKWGEGAEE